MSQNSVLRLLEKANKPMSVSEISKILGIRSVSKNLLILRRHSEIKWVWKIVNFKSKIKGGTIEKPVLHYFV